jgi:lysyl-tRNA synthetase class 2
MSDSTPAINEYEQERRNKREQIRAMGLDPYGHAEKSVKPLAVVKSLYTAEMGHDGGPAVTVAGRIVLKRDMGKLSFLSLRDESGDLQIALDKKRLDDPAWAVNSLLDLGDQIVVDGALGVTKKGEVTVWATALRVSSKSVLPPPGKWDGLADIETRYRQRYVDLWANPQVMTTLKLRSAVVAEVRAYLTGLGYTEVETPMMQPMAGGAAARPFTTHHNALDIPLFLRIAPELYLKRLLVGGFTKVFELNRNFRNEGVSPRHNPEFTMLEAYEAYGSWETMADLVEGMVCHIAEKLFGGLKIEHKNAAGEVTKTINLTRPWRRASIATLVEERTGWKFDKRSAEAAGYVDSDNGSVADIFNQYGGVLSNAYSDMPEDVSKTRVDQGVSAFAMQFRVLTPAEQLKEVYEKLVEPTLGDPCFVTRFPSVIIPLAKRCSDDDYFADVYELAINGQEISPGYTELNDPDVQAANFATQVGDEAERQKTDDDFLTALKYGMPPAGGLGLGIDRLVMMLTGAESIRDVILFPLMRPQG